MNEWGYLLPNETEQTEHLKKSAGYLHTKVPF